MAKNKKLGVISTITVFEAEEDNFAATRDFLLLQQKQISRRLRNAAAATQIYDKNGVPIGLDVTGNPSDEMRALMEREFADDEEDIGA